MKGNIKIFLIALVIGLVVAYFVNYKFDVPTLSYALAPEATIFYVGAYNDADLASVKQNSYDNAVVYKDGDIYKVVIGIYCKDDIKDLMESYFLDQGIIFASSKIKVNNVLYKNMENYELLIKNSTKEYYVGLNNTLLNLFQEYIN